MWAVGLWLFLSELCFVPLLISVTVWQSPTSAGLEGCLYLLKCGWPHLVSGGITLVCGTCCDVWARLYDFRMEILELKYLMSDTELVSGTPIDAETQTVTLLYNGNTESS